MSRPMDMEKRRELALSALEVLREHGLQQATMSGIAKALEIKRPTLYFYFPSIPDLFVALVEILREDELAWVAERMQGHAHPIDALGVFLRAEHAFVVERGLDDVMLLMTSFWASGSREHRERFRSLVLKDLLPARSMFIGLLQHGIASNLVHPCDVEAVVDLIFSIQDGILVQGGVRDLDVEPLFALVEDTVLAPLKVNAA
ncbi:MAG: TetR/AcrR family transcriptional regulator [Myxococcota bacterium]